MHIVWFSWKDRWHPQAGGAETVSGEIMDRLARDGHTITLFTAMYPGASQYEQKRDVSIYRSGNRFTVYLKALFSYRRYQKTHEKPSLVIDEMNTIPFFAGAYVKASQKVLLSYQLAREVWFYQMLPVLSHIGFVIEPLYLALVAKLYPTVLTESLSSKRDMEKYGLKNIKTFSIGMALEPLKTLKAKPTSPVVLSLGAVRPMKRTIDAVKAFEEAHSINPDLKMIIAGDISGGYGDSLKGYVAKSRSKANIDILGRVSSEKRLKLMREAGVILVTSIKEGWGLIVTEANSQGTPAVVYDVDGLRDSVRHKKTGIVSANNDPLALGRAVVDILADQTAYKKIRQTAWIWSKEFTFEKSYRDFCKKANIPL